MTTTEAYNDLVAAEAALDAILARPAFDGQDDEADRAGDLRDAALARLEALKTAEAERREWDGVAWGHGASGLPPMACLRLRSIEG